MIAMSYQKKSSSTVLRNQHLFVKYIEHVDEVDIEEMERHLDKVAKNWWNRMKTTCLHLLEVSSLPMGPLLRSDFQNQKV